MLRNLQEISDGKIYGTKDMVRAACHDCEGCHACCEDMGTSIILDPYDIWNLQMGTGATFEELLGAALELHVVEGLILPNLKMTEERGRCHFLNEEGRCSIHANRPGLCRVFPLGRIYEEGQITYFLQADGCKKAERSKVKVEKWLDGAGDRQMEQYLLQWHGLRKKLQEYLQTETDGERAKTVNMFLLNLFFVTPYEQGEFFGQFAKRYEQVAKVL